MPALHLWAPGARDEPLRVDRCHALVRHTVGLGYRVYQCPHKAKTTRPFRDGVERPCCGIHARTYDRDAIREAEFRALAARRDFAKARARRLEQALGFSVHTAAGAFVCIPAADLERLAEAAGYTLPTLDVDDPEDAHVVDDDLNLPPTY